MPFLNRPPLNSRLLRGVPPFDSFNNNGNNFGNIEGAVWFDGAIHVSEIGGGNNPPPARILRITTAGTVSIAFPTSGTNGLAIDTTGRLIGANHVGRPATSLSPGERTRAVLALLMAGRVVPPSPWRLRPPGAGLALPVSTRAALTAMKLGGKGKAAQQQLLGK